MTLAPPSAAALAADKSLRHRQRNDDYVDFHRCALAKADKHNTRMLSTTTAFFTGAPS